jgi:hypothetical protein
VPTEADDLSAGYTMINIEMITRRPHSGSAYQLDKHKAWEITKNICGRNTCYIYIKGATKAKDHREAFCVLFEHYIGANNVGNSATAAEERLQSTRYSGDNHNFDFEKYVQIHTEQHPVLNGLMKHGYWGVDEISKVRLIFSGITTSNYDIVKS